MRRWCCGIATLYRFSHTRSPKTPCDIQLSVFWGGGNSLGLTHSHNRARETGTIAHGPIQMRLQTARLIRGRAATRLHPLQGLAWRCQISGDIRISFSARSAKFTTIEAPGCDHKAMVNAKAACRHRDLVMDVRWGNCRSSPLEI